jgi:hypothetical protein
LKDAPHIAVLDGGSFVLPYDHGLVTGLVQRGWRVSFFGSRTRYSSEFLQALREYRGVQVIDEAISSSMVPRWHGVLGYIRLLATLWRQRRRFAAVNLQFSVLWPLELALLGLLRRRLVFTVHNAVPHGFKGRRHRPTQWLAALAQRLVFASETTRDDFLQRYGAHHAKRCAVLRHGLLPLAPHLAAVAYKPRAAPEALVFWSNVKAYKGVELFAELARSPQWRAQGLALEVYGRWAHELAPLRDELVGLGVKVADAYLDTAALQALLSRNVVFVLPYREASQSGALYTLLHHGCLFMCSDVGDLGAFMRRFDLQALMLRERSAAAVLACLQHVREHAGGVARAFSAAQDASNWRRTLSNAEAAYGIAAAPTP